MNGGSDSYNVSSKYYDDAYATKQDLQDIPFYLELAKRFGGPILEIACGTGRVLLSIARQGIEVHGVDNALPMLGVLKNRLENETHEVRQRVTIHEGDMRTFRLEQKFPLVVIPFRPMQHMYTVADQAAALSTAAFHLEQKGILAFDVFFPKFEAIPAGIREEHLDLEWPLAADPGKIVRRYFRRESFDKINQTFNAVFIFRTYQGENIVSEETEPLKMSYYSYPQLRALFLVTGLEVAEEYGSFAKTPLDNNAEQMIFVLRRVGGVEPGRSLS